MVSQTFVNRGGQPEHLQEPLLDGAQRRQVHLDVAVDLQAAQGQSLKRPQHQLRSRARRGPFGVTGIEPGHLLALGVQVAPGAEFEQGQHAQANRQQTNQAGDASVRVQIQRGQGQRLAFQATEAVFDQILSPIGQHRLGQG